MTSKTTATPQKEEVPKTEGPETPPDSPLLDHSDAAVKKLIQSNLRETTTRVLASLTPREERILRMRFGIGMNSDHTLEEVGHKFSVKLALLDLLPPSQKYEDESYRHVDRCDQGDGAPHVGNNSGPVHRLPPIFGCEPHH